LTRTVDNCKSLNQHQLDRRRHYGPIFIRLAVVTSPNRDVTRNSDKILPLAVQGHPRSLILVPIKSAYRYTTSYH